MRGLVVAAAALMLAAGQAWAQCPVPEERGVAVDVRIETASPVYRNDLDSAALARIASGMALGRHRGRVLGLTVASFAVDLKPRYQALRAADGRWCLWLRRIEARLFIPETTVHIASAYRKDSCPYRHILEHEHEHVSITQAALRTAAPRLEATLRAAARTVNPLLVGDRTQAERLIDAALAPSVDSFVTSLTRQAQRDNMPIDTDASYEKVASNCRMW